MECETFIIRSYYCLGVKGLYIGGKLANFRIWLNIRAIWRCKYGNLKQYKTLNLSDFNPILC